MRLKIHQIDVAVTYSGLPAPAEAVLILAPLMLRQRMDVLAPVLTMTAFQSAAVAGDTAGVAHPDVCKTSFCIFTVFGQPVPLHGRGAP